MNITNYEHKQFKLKLNKNQLPLNNFTFEELDEFNNIYYYIRDKYELVKCTPSHGICNKINQKFNERYFIVKGNQRFEMILISNEGCYRFLLQNKKAEDNTVSGQQACRSVYNKCDEYHINLLKYSTEDGLQAKSEIEKPHIEVLEKIVLGKPIDNVYHMDFKSSYASRISEAYPELRPMYEDIYSHRKENDGYYKHVLTNSIGCWQSEYCVDYTNRYKIKPYQFANLSKTAINGTRAKVEEMIVKLDNANRVPLLTNTDGIWYYSNRGPYHDENEGNQLGNWENDHLDCKFIMVSKGAYQYVENGKCETVVRGICNLDAIEQDRSKWEFGFIKDMDDVYTYKFDYDKGVYKTYE